MDSDSSSNTSVSSSNSSSSASIDIIFSSDDIVLSDSDEEEEDVYRIIAGRLNLTDVIAECAEEYARNELFPKRQNRLGPRQKPKQYDYAGARLSVLRDFLGLRPIFADHQFTEIFRVTRRHYEMIRNDLGRNSKFFTHGTDATGKGGISPDCKILLALKVLAFGHTPLAEIPYFQMDKNVALKCVKEFGRIMSRKGTLRMKYLRRMNARDYHRVTELHRQKYGVAGILGGIDCSHLRWNKCPVAWQGQMKGKEKIPTIVLEAMCDENLWIWHAAVGYPGTMNDINIWDDSNLLETFLSDEWNLVMEREFQIGGDTFNKALCLVDGIYPCLSRFIKTISHPVTEGEKNYVKWQEGKRKAIERAFAVLFGKFQWLDSRINLRSVGEICNIALSCILLHNMMVEYRVDRDEEEDTSFYGVDANIVRQYSASHFRLADESVIAVDSSAMDIDATYEERDALVELLRNRSEEINKKRFQHLVSLDEHIRVQNAIIRELSGT